MKKYFLLTIVLLHALFATACGSATSNKQPSDMTYANPRWQKLAEASMRGDEKTIVELVKHGVDVNATSKEGMTALFWASRDNSLEGMRALLKAGADPWFGMQMTRGVYTMPELIVENQKLDQLKLLLDTGMNPNHPMPSNDVSLLHMAAIYGWKEGVELLLDSGADMNYSPKGFDSVPGNAISGGRYDIVLLLIERGYNQNLDDLAADTQIRLVNEEREPDRQKVIAWLKSKGVKYPVFEEKQDDDEVYVGTPNKE